MSRATLVLISDAFRARAHAWIDRAPHETRIEFKAPKRTLPQNARMWAMLTDIATQLTWHGVRLTADDWKLIFLDALKTEIRMVPNIHGTGFINLGRSSSDLSKAEMGDLMDLIAAFGADHGVIFHDGGGRPVTERRRLSVTDKLSIMVRQSVCQIRYM